MLLDGSVSVSRRRFTSMEASELKLVQDAEHTSRFSATRQAAQGKVAAFGAEQHRQVCAISNT